MSNPTVRYPSAEDCPKVETHTSSPTGYLAWHNWAERMAKTHRQVWCPTCGFFAIWVPKRAQSAKSH